MDNGAAGQDMLTVVYVSCQLRSSMAVTRFGRLSQPGEGDSLDFHSLALLHPTNVSTLKKRLTKRKTSQLDERDVKVMVRLRDDNRRPAFHGFIGGNVVFNASTSHNHSQILRKDANILTLIQLARNRHATFSLDTVFAFASAKWVVKPLHLQRVRPISVPCIKCS
jgi:hypothetical protein